MYTFFSSLLPQYVEQSNKFLHLQITSLSPIILTSFLLHSSLFYAAPAKAALKEKPLSNQTPSFFFGTDRGALIYADDLGECLCYFFLLLLNNGIRTRV